MDVIIESTIQTLKKAEVLLNSLGNSQLCDATVPPYYSSIGSHIRHILDFYDCVLRGDGENTIDLTARSRNKTVEADCDCALSYLNSILQQLKNATFDNGKSILVLDDLGMGKTQIAYTFGALLAQANSHTIHHYAIINYILDRLGVTVNDSDFGYNPTTPKQVAKG